jgi:hypothetical protein
LPKTWKNLYYPPEKNEYVYFEAGTQYPFTQSADTRAAWAADAAMLAYGRYGQALIPESDFSNILRSAGFAHHQLIGDWSGGAGTQAFFAYNGGFAILSFRGTERDDPSDSATDADIVPVPEKDYTISSGHLHPFHFLADLVHGEACLVHRGFQRALDSVWQQVSDCITAYRAANVTAEICFTGHSLGGAVATLAISRIADPRVSLVTIGCPRVGNAVFCSRVLKRATLGIYRYVDGDDPVTHIPVDGLYRHPPADWMHIVDAEHGKIETLHAGDGQRAGADWADLLAMIQGLPHAGLPWNLDSPAPQKLVDHSPAQYTVALWKKVDPRIEPIK